MRGDQNLGAIISHPSCCSELVSVDYSKYTPNTDLRSNTAALPLMLRPKTKVKDPYISAWGPPVATGSDWLLNTIQQQ